MIIEKKSRIIVMGIQAKSSLLQVKKMMEVGMNITAGILPGRGGDWILDGGVPVFDSIQAAVDTTGVDAAILFDDGFESSDGLSEAVFCEIPVIVCSISDIPVRDMLRIKRASEQRGLLLLGPGSPGIYSPEEIIAGIMPKKLGCKGDVGIISSSAALGFEIISFLKQKEIGISTFIGIGESPICGSGFDRIIPLFEMNAETRIILLIDTPFGPVKGLDINQIGQSITKPVAAYCPGSELIQSGSLNLPRSFKQKRAEIFLSVKRSLYDAGIPVAETPEELPALLF